MIMQATPLPGEFAGAKNIALDARRIAIVAYKVAMLPTLAASEQEWTPCRNNNGLCICRVKFTPAGGTKSAPARGTPDCQ